MLLNFAERQAGMQDFGRERKRPNRSQCQAGSCAGVREGNKAAEPLKVLGRAVLGKGQITKITWHSAEETGPSAAVTSTSGTTAASTATRLP